MMTLKVNPSCDEATICVHQHGAVEKREGATVDVIDDYHHNLDFHDYDVEEDDFCGADF